MTDGFVGITYKDHCALTNSNVYRECLNQVYERVMNSGKELSKSFGFESSYLRIKPCLRIKEKTAIIGFAIMLLEIMVKLEIIDKINRNTIQI